MSFLCSKEQGTPTSRLNINTRPVISKDKVNYTVVKTSSYLIVDSLMRIATVKPPIKDTPKEDKPPNKGQTNSRYSCIYIRYKERVLFQAVIHLLLAGIFYFGHTKRGFCMTEI